MSNTIGGVKSESASPEAGQSATAAAPTVGSRGDLAAKLDERLAAMTEEERGRAYVQANCFEWPDALPDLKPEGWDARTDREKYESDEGTAVWEAVKKHTSPFQQSKAWWVEKMKKTPEQHSQWWATQGKYFYE